MLWPFPLENMKKIGYHNPTLSKEILNNYIRFKIDCFISIFLSGFHSTAKYVLNSLF